MLPSTGLLLSFMGRVEQNCCSLRRAFMSAICSASSRLLRSSITILSAQNLFALDVFQSLPDEPKGWVERRWDLVTLLNALTVSAASASFCCMGLLDYGGPCSSSFFFRDVSRWQEWGKKLRIQMYELSEMEFVERWGYSMQSVVESRSQCMSQSHKSGVNHPGIARFHLSFVSETPKLAFKSSQ